MSGREWARDTEAVNHVAKITLEVIPIINLGYEMCSK